MGAPLGNQNAANAKMWKAAIERALDARGAGDRKVALDALAERLLAKCDDNDLGALKELGDRIDGKPAQSVDLGNADGKPFTVEQIVRRIVDPAN